MSVPIILSSPTVTSRVARSLSSLSLRPRTTEPMSVVRHVSSQLLLDGGRELVIQHQGSEYHLRLTRNDKLILTK